MTLDEFQCPKCGKVEEVLIPASTVSHCCPANLNRPIFFKKVNPSEREKA